MRTIVIEINIQPVEAEKISVMCAATQTIKKINFKLFQIGNIH